MAHLHSSMRSSVCIGITVCLGTGFRMLPWRRLRATPQGRAPAVRVDLQVGMCITVCLGTGVRMLPWRRLQAAPQGRAPAVRVDLHVNMCITVCLGTGVRMLPWRMLQATPQGHAPAVRVDLQVGKGQEVGDDQVAPAGHVAVALHEGGRVGARAERRLRALPGGDLVLAQVGHRDLGLRPAPPPPASRRCAQSMQRKAARRNCGAGQAEQLQDCTSCQAGHLSQLARWNSNNSENKTERER
jgi:hypothetical protein